MILTLDRELAQTIHPVSSLQIIKKMTYFMIALRIMTTDKWKKFWVESSDILL